MEVYLFRQYEIAMGAGQAMGDRLAQMEAMDGAARCLEALRFVITIQINFKILSLWLLL